MVYYRKPMHAQGVFCNMDSNVADCPVTEQLCEAVLSLPMHPYLTKEMIVGVTDSLKKAFH